MLRRYGASARRDSVRRSYHRVITEHKQCALNWTICKI
jgi:hypothetical protein